MNRYHIPLYDESDDSPKGEISVEAEDGLEADAIAFQWLLKKPGLTMDIYGARIERIEVDD